jgi:hypothetical protein
MVSLSIRGEGRTTPSPRMKIKDTEGKESMSTYMVTHKQRSQLQEVRGVYYYDTTVGDPSDTEWQDIADEIRADYVSDLGTGLCDQWEIYAIDYRRVDVAGLPTFSKGFTSGTYVGPSASDPVANQLALLCTITAPTTKPNRIRKYFAGSHEANMTGGLWSTSIRSAFEDLLASQSVLNGAGTNPLVLVAAQWNTQHTQVIATNDVSAGNLQSFAIPATQRRRRIGVGI